MENYEHKIKNKNKKLIICSKVGGALLIIKQCCLILFVKIFISSNINVIINNINYINVIIVILINVIEFC